MHSAASRDPSSGLDASREFARCGAAELEWFAENVLVVASDPKLDVGLWPPLGTGADDFGLYKDQVLISLPADGGQL